MNKAFEQIVGTISDLVADNEDVQRESRAFALKELNLTEAPSEEDTIVYQFYWELIATFITKALIQAAQKQRLIR